MSENVKRYMVECYPFDMMEDSDGGYVKYDDHEAEVSQLKARIDELEKEFRDLRDWCHEDSDWYKHMDAFIEDRECEHICQFCHAKATAKAERGAE